MPRRFAVDETPPRPVGFGETCRWRHLDHLVRKSEASRQLGGAWGIQVAMAFVKGVDRPGLERHVLPNQRHQQPAAVVAAGQRQHRLGVGHAGTALDRPVEQSLNLLDRRRRHGFGGACQRAHVEPGPIGQAGGGELEPAPRRKTRHTHGQRPVARHVARAHHHRPGQHVWTIAVGQEVTRVGREEDSCAETPVVQRRHPERIAQKRQVSTTAADQGRGEHAVVPPNRGLRTRSGSGRPGPSRR